MIKIDFKHLFKIKKKKNTGPVFGVDADDDWRVIMTSFLVITVFVIIWNGFIFYKTNVALKKEDPKEVTTKLIDQKTLEEMVVKYIAQALEFEKVKNESTVISDPSR